MQVALIGGVATVLGVLILLGARRLLSFLRQHDDYSQIPENEFKPEPEVAV